MILGAALGALKIGGKLLAKTKIGSKVAGKLAEGAGKLFSGKLKKERAAVKQASEATQVSTQKSAPQSPKQDSAGGFMDMVKKYWYVPVGIVLLILGIVLFKPKKRRK